MELTQLFYEHARGGTKVTFRPHCPTPEYGNVYSSKLYLYAQQQKKSSVRNHVSQRL